LSGVVLEKELLALGRAGGRRSSPSRPWTAGKRGAIHELERLAAELPQVGADKAWERSTASPPPQRRCIEDLLRAVTELVDPPT
jgi:hypothetical protein